MTSLPEHSTSIVVRLRKLASQLADDTDFHEGKPLTAADTMYTVAADEIERLSKELADLKGEASFLLARLSDLEFSDMDDLVRDYDGHVEPSISRLRTLTSKATQ